MGYGEFAFIICIFAVAIIYVPFGISHARKADATMAAYQGFFTKSQAYFYGNAIYLAAICFPLGVLTLFGKAPATPGISRGVEILLCFVVGTLCVMYVKNKQKKLKEKYGEIAAKEIIKAMIIVGDGRSFRRAAKLFGIIAFESLDHEYVATDRGHVRVVKTGEHTYIDAEGNSYIDKDLV